MENKQIIAQLKALKSIKPSDGWVENTKSFILGNFHTEETAPSRGFLFPFQPARLVPIAIPAFIIMIVGAGITAHFYLQAINSGKTAILPTENTTATYLVLAQTKLNSLEKPEDIKEVADMLVKATNGMSLVSKNPTETAKIVESVTIINKKIEELGASGENIDQVAELGAAGEILTTKIGEVLKQNIQDTREVLAKNLIEMIGTKTLTEDQIEIFKQAKADYDNGDFVESVTKNSQIWEDLLKNNK
jgi:hypothetical protein